MKSLLAERRGQECPAGQRRISGSDHSGRRRPDEAVRLLLEKGAEVNIKGPGGFTALMLAASNGHAETVRLLLEKGADLNAKTRLGQTALVLASQAGRSDAVKVLSEKGARLDTKADAFTDGITQMGLDKKDQAGVEKVLGPKAAEVKAAVAPFRHSASRRGGARGHEHG